MAQNVWKGPAIVWKTAKPRYEIKSSVFSSLGVTWQLELIAYTYPEIKSYALYLRPTKEIKLKTSFSVITSVQSSLDSMTNGCIYKSHCVKTIVDYDGNKRLWSCSVSLALEDICYFKDSKYLTVICVFPANHGILNETIEVTTQTEFDRPLLVRHLQDVKQSSDASLDSLSVDLSKLLEDKVVPDINLRCGDRTVAAHKAILSARSQVFSAMFQSKMSESETGVVDITDVDADVLETFLMYVYSGRLSDLSDETLTSLYAAGDKYDVRALKKECSERMINNLSGENCLNILLLADAHSDQDLKDVILDFILNHVEILKSNGWKKFCKENSTLSTEVFQFVVERKWF